MLLSSIAAQGSLFQTVHFLSKISSQCVANFFLNLLSAEVRGSILGSLVLAQNAWYQPWVEVRIEMDGQQSMCSIQPVAFVNENDFWAVLWCYSFLPTENKGEILALAMDLEAVQVCES